MISLETPIDWVPKINRKIIPALKRLEIHTIRDLLFHFPSRYEDFSAVTDSRSAEAGKTVTIQGAIKKISVRRTARKRMVLTEAVVQDERGTIKTLWFNQPFLARNLKEGDRVALSGKVALGPGGKYLQNPAYERIMNQESGIRNHGIHTGGLVAVYPETRGITSRWLRSLINKFIDYRKYLSDPLPAETRRRHQLPDIQQAIFSIHFAKDVQSAEKAKRRFSFQELLMIQLLSSRERLKLSRNKAPEIPFRLSLIKEFVGSLPFELTNAQRRSIWEILQDISKPRPMNRLLEGDVGSGKTVVAAASSLMVVKSGGYKVIFMAPTEILAKQHHTTLEKLLSPFGVKVGLITSADKKNKDGADIYVGTHALLQNTNFDRPGLVIIDEQHRFGVSQRAALARSNNTDNSGPTLLPHFLSMSATPIPRTLALTIYGDLDLSILDEMPKSRKAVVTKVIEPEKREEAYGFIRSEVGKGRQVFVICPRIENTSADDKPAANLPISELSWQKLEVKTVKEEYDKLSKKVFPDLRVAMLYGRMKPKEKDAVMAKFKGGAIDVLVSTSVIEVGVDVPNATIMMIEGAERFGLAQLHQFRGRVGRGSEQSYCFLFTSEGIGTTRRLRAVVEAKSGFELAEKDLEIRGVGDLFGVRQWGVSGSALASLTDSKLVREVRQEVKEILKKDPELNTYPYLRSELARMEKNMHPE